MRHPPFRTQILITRCGEACSSPLSHTQSPAIHLAPSNRWLSVRFNLLSAGIFGAAAAVSLITPSTNASSAGFALAFASTITNELLFMVRRFVRLEQSIVHFIYGCISTLVDNKSQVALERVKEYSELNQEALEFTEPRPFPDWPSAGSIKCENLVIRYAVGSAFSRKYSEWGTDCLHQQPELPDVLHKLNLSIRPGEKVTVSCTFSLEAWTQY